MTYDVYHLCLTPANDTSREIVMALLAAAGFDSFQETDDGCDAYIDQQQMSETQMASLLQEFQLPNVQISFTKEQLEQRDWNEQWEQEGFQPIIVPGLCAIHRPEQEVEPQAFDILVNPRMAFGSGTHETTSQLVEILLRSDLSGQNCLDMGCGTGILTICMALAKAETVTAIDIDEFSVANARENCQLNNITNVEVIHGDASAIEGEFDLIVANIHRNIIVADLPTYVQHLKKGGTLLVSGFFTDDIHAVSHPALQQGLQLVRQQERNGWAVLHFQR
jgi:ribosomal protein L11 methyltransferase